MDEERHWLEAARRGNQQAITRLIEAYQAQVYGLCCRLLEDAREAEDAAQETFIKALTGLHSYDLQRPFRPWLMRIASNECIDRLRRRRGEASLDAMDEACDAWDWMAGTDPLPEDALEEQELRAALRRCMRSLPPEDVMVLKLFYWMNYSYEEIATLTGMTLQALKSRLFRARRALARQLMEEGHV